MSPTPPTISDAEWRVMEVIWDHGPIAAQDVVDRLAEATDWKPNTIKTMLGRLVRKGALAHRSEGNRYIYRSRVRRDTCVRAESSSFLDRVFGGDTLSAIVHLAEQSDLDAKQIAKLRRMLEEQE